MPASPDMMRLEPLVLPLLFGGLALAARVMAQDASEPNDRPAQILQRLIDEFHRVMPPDPEALADAEVRRRVAPIALPVIRDFVRHLRADPEREGDAVQAAELAVFAAILEHDATGRETEPPVPGSDDAPRGSTLPERLRATAAAVVVAGDRAAREAAMIRFGSALATAVPDGPHAAAARGATRAVARVARLTPEEARGLASRVADERVVVVLTEAATRAERDPRRRIGQALTLAGAEIDGDRFTTASLAGKVVLVDFWATWCVPCQRAMPEIARLAHEHGAAGLEVVGVSCDSDAADLAAWRATHPDYDWPQLFEPGQPRWHPLATKLGITAIPCTLLIDRRGILRGVNAHGDALEALLVDLLAEPPRPRDGY